MTTTQPASAARQPILSIRARSARHERIQVVSGFSAEIAAGEIVAVLGANGAGKSSLLGSLAGVVTGSGEIMVQGRRLDSAPAHRRSVEGLALVPEQRRNIFSSLTVRENLEISLRLARNERREAVRSDLMALFPILEERIAALAGMLSGGEQQMLAIAMALAREPSVLLLDEPTQGLAPTVFDDLERTFLLLRERGLAILIAEQNLDFTKRIADRFIMLSYGMSVATGDARKLRESESELSAIMTGESDPSEGAALKTDVNTGRN